METAAVRAMRDNLQEQLGRVIVGQREALDLMLVSLLSEGHILLEGVPGTAKTLMAQAFAACLSLDFGRVQFTPDLMPGDVIGTNLFNFQTNRFVLTKGPIFTQLLLADEINRTPPKTQAALLQAMQERCVTIDGENHALGAGFMVIATQNPLEQEGTYPLPEAQLDRFLFKVIVDYPSAEEERAIVARHGTRTAMPALDTFGLRPVADLGAIEQARALVREVQLSDENIDYLVSIVRATRETPSLYYGASPRASNMLATAARAWAVLAGRDFVLPDDIKQLVTPVLRHRVLLAPGAEIEGLSVESVLQQLTERIAAPR